MSEKLTSLKLKTREYRVALKAFDFIYTTLTFTKSSQNKATRASVYFL